MIRKRVLRTGDGSHRYSKAKTTRELLDAYNNNSNNNDGDDENVDTLWGWGTILFTLRNYFV